MLRFKVFLLALMLSMPSMAAEMAASPNFDSAVAQLRTAVGEWNVTTEFLAEDGTVKRTLEGSYVFEWVIENRVVQGRSEMPELGTAAGILFYVNEKKQVIEMVSVGADGRLWVMTGPVGEETRYTQKYTSQNGKDSQFRFTRYNVTEDRFESKMEYTDDGGKTWKPGNHQVFVRRK